MIFSLSLSLCQLGTVNVDDLMKGDEVEWVVNVVEKR